MPSRWTLRTWVCIATVANKSLGIQITPNYLIVIVISPAAERGRERSSTNHLAFDEPRGFNPGRLRSFEMARPLFTRIVPIRTDRDGLLVTTL